MTVIKGSFFPECVKIFLATFSLEGRIDIYIYRGRRHATGLSFQGSLRSRSRLFLPRARGSNEELVRGSRESR